MLSFGTALTGALKSRNVSPFWYIKLYYGDESSFTGLSDKDRTIGGVKYRGLVQGWGQLTQAWSPSDFSVATNTSSITIDNTPDKISGGRFSDLFATQNYLGRKWELFFDCVEANDPIQIGGGAVAEQINQDNGDITFRLADASVSEGAQVPISLVEKDTYTDAPEGNKGKPFPMVYGDFSARTSTGEWERHYTWGKAPAIITNTQNSSGQIECAPDTLDTSRSVLLNAFNDKNLFMYKDGYYLSCDDGNVTVVATPTTEADNVVKFNGSEWYAYIPLVLTGAAALDANSANIVDGDPDGTGSVFTCPANDTATVTLQVPQVGKLGEGYANANIDFIINLSAFSGTPTPAGADDFYVNISGDTVDLGWGVTGAKAVSFTSAYGSAALTAGNISGTLTINIDNSINGSPVTATIKEVALQIQIEPSQVYEYPSMVQKLIKTYGYRQRRVSIFNIPIEKKRYVYRTEEVDGTAQGPAGLEYAFVGVKGREFGAWVDADSRDNGYDSGDLIENPIYIVEDILRSEIGLTSSEIDYASFDTAGNTTDGKIGNVFDDAVSDIKFALSQVNSADGFSLCRRIAAACGGILFWSGSGKIKIAIRQKDEDYTAGDFTIEYDDITGPAPGRTKIQEVLNRIVVSFDYSHGQDAYLQTTYQSDDAAANDTTSQGDGATGINDIREMSYECPYILEDTTAKALNAALLDWYSKQRLTLDFQTVTPRYNDAEIGDTFDITNWPSDWKLYGNTIGSTDIFKITKISKTPGGASISAIKVSEVTD